MLFNSLHYLIFFPTVLLLYFAIPYRHRWMLLLAASYYFYMSWKAEYALLILASTTVDYVCGLKMASARSQRVKKLFLGLSLGFNLGMLFAFKYFNFFSDSLRIALNQFNIFYDSPTFQMLLPVGISFYVFQSLAYTINVYKDRIQPEKHFGIFMVYVSFFPQLVAGPIERPHRLLPQFHLKHDFDYRRAVDGLLLFCWGLFKKVVIADRLSMVVDRVFNHPGEFEGLSLALAAVFFTFQIYCDFSGYTDMALGSARILGFDLMQNFNRPYLATSIPEFWKRWHISLSSWFRDYVYIPLGGNQVGPARWYFNILIVFLVSGIWHGANWTFVFWGALHGVALMASRFSEPSRLAMARFTGLARLPRLHQAFRVLITFCLVAFFWIPFRAANIHDALLIMKGIFVADTFSLDLTQMGLTPFSLVYMLGLLLFLYIADWVGSRFPIRQELTLKPVFMRWAFYYASIAVILLLGRFESSPFIYFQF